MENKATRTRSFRDEDYYNRRVFLRSYPLHWGDEEENEEQEKARKVPSGRNHSSRNMNYKDLLIAVLEWSDGKVLVLRRFKQKVAVLIAACIPVRFKSPTGLISNYK